MTEIRDPSTIQATECTRVCVCGVCNYWKSGYEWIDGKKYQRFKCKDCKRVYTSKIIVGVATEAVVGSKGDSEFDYEGFRLW